MTDDDLEKAWLAEAAGLIRRVRLGETWAAVDEATGKAFYIHRRPRDGEIEIKPKGLKLIRVAVEATAE